MKQILFKIIACCTALLSLAACEKSGDLPAGDEYTGTGSIFLNFSTGEAGAPSSRADGTSFDTSFETRVDHLDVLIFNDDGNKMCYEHFDTDAAANGRITLAAKRRSFNANESYWVYLIANSNDAEQEAFGRANFDRDALMSLVRYNPYMHLTGMPNNTPNGAGYELPQNFLMDGAAYTGATEPALENAGKVVLNDGTAQHDTNLKVFLRRAAVKLVLKIKPDPTYIKILDPADVSGVVSTSGYYLRNMPYTTSLLSGVGHEALLRTPRQTRNHYFELHSSGVDENNMRIIDGITVTSYVYAHNWTSSSNMENETRWIVDIPLEYDTGAKDRVVVPYMHSYYQVPVCYGTELERNTCYTVSVTLRSPGGTAPSAPVTLTDVRYEVLTDWIDKEIPIGNSDSRPMFLTLNRTEIEMHDANPQDPTATDATLEFISSSEVTATVKRVYYIDKFGVEQDESTDIVTLTPISPDSGLSGNISIHTDPKPTNNATRYIDIEVTNKDGVAPRTVKVKQYPLEYITNILGWYSYRTDFWDEEYGGSSATTYELLNGEDVIGTTYYRNSDPRPPFEANDWICGCAWDATKNVWTYGHDVTGFFGSKVAGPVATSGSDQGKAYIYYYRWKRNQTGSNRNRSYTYTVDYYNEWLNDNNPDNDADENKGIWKRYANPRMYHVRLTSSSEKYTIGRPRITNGITDGGADNAKLVSPSFLIASQLGAVMDVPSLEVATDHCKHYVEVYKDKSGKAVHLKDWRLPTEAEINIILDFQMVPNAAMDLVLGGYGYYSASGPVYNPNSEDDYFKKIAIRCVRDAFDITDNDAEASKDADAAADAQ